MPTIFLSETTGLHKSDFSVSVQVLLIAHEHDDNVWTSQRPSISQPVSQGIVRLTAEWREGERGGEGEERQVRLTSFFQRLLTLKCRTPRAPLLLHGSSCG